jgi:predicted component of type VI protein secretion system
MTVKTSPKCVKAKAPQKRTVEEIEDLKLDLTELKQGILPALSRICSRCEELIEENRILRQALEEVERDERDFDSMHRANAKLTAQYLTAKSLINIPDNIAGLVEELIKTRLLVWDKSVMDVTANPEKFDAFPELNNAFSKKGKTKTEKRK